LAERTRFMKQSEILNDRHFLTFEPDFIQSMPDNIIFSQSPGTDLVHFVSNKNYSKICVLTDENTHALCYPVIAKILPAHEVIMVKSGEEAKNLRTCEQIWNAMTVQQMDRHSVMIVLGGGVLGDMGGFCAATYKRGIDFILIPTTLLSQVDASIGGKLGIDFQNFKNHIGVFQIPALTILHSGFLKTLADSEKKSGFAEVIKHTLISDASMWNRLKEKSIENQDWDTLIKHSVDFKSKVVAEDPKEKGLRKILNAGHTIGHAIETFLLENGRKVMHGEAIAAGMICENYLAVKAGMLTTHEDQEISTYILKTYGKLQINSSEDDAIAALALQDKKNKGNRILCVLLEGIGKAKWDCEISLNDIKDALKYYRTLQPQM
jgi:3-dehydroquinate synthase